MSDPLLDAVLTVQPLALRGFVYVSRGVWRRGPGEWFTTEAVALHMGLLARELRAHELALDAGRQEPRAVA